MKRDSSGLLAITLRTGLMVALAIILILVLLWLLGAFVMPFGGDVIHLLLVVALVVVVIRVLDGRRRI